MRGSLVLVLVWFSGCALAPPGNPPPVLQPVLMIVAHNGLYYQEYADPRRALEAAGLTAVVASTATTAVTPHDGSWEPGTTVLPVVPDRLLAGTVSTGYSALVISGGWGATNYYYAFTGTLAAGQEAWAPVPSAAGEVNRLINEFLAANKPILAICNGVNVLSWARLDGTDPPLSPLSGKPVSAPYLFAPPMTYLGVDYDDNQLPFHTFATDNGATVAPFNSVGDSSSFRDDVTISGLILTAQDNFSAYEGGRILAGKLLAGG